MRFGPSHTPRPALSRALSRASFRTSSRALGVFALAAFATLTLAPMASAQHAKFVLFGESDPAGLALPAERKAVHPVTSPYYHEDSFITTDARAWFLYHDFPNDSVIGGGNAKVYALQLRLALTEQLQLVAYKDGYTVLDSGAVSDDGWNDIAAGLKWNFHQDWENDFHAAVGLGYQFSAGDDEALQGDSELRLWGSINKGFDKLHLGGTLNLLVPTDSEDALGDSTRLFWHLHADYYVCEWFSPVIELNGYHTIDEGDNTPLPFSGIDVGSLGGGGDEDVVAIGLGAELRPTDFLALRAAWETALTDNDDLFGNRLTLSAVVSY